MKLLLSLFSANWKTWFFWGIFFGLAHLFGSYINIESHAQQFPWLCKLLEFGDQQFVATITEVYAGLYAIGVPLLFTLLEKALSQHKTVAARDYILKDNDIVFFFNVTPLFLIYTISVLFFSLENDFHTIVLYIIVCTSFIRFYMLVRLFIRVFTDLTELLNEKSKKDIQSILNEIK